MMSRAGGFRLGLTRKRKRNSNSHDDHDDYNESNGEQQFNKKKSRKIKKKRKIPRLKIGDRVNFSEVLFTEHRDFLITYNNRDRPVYIIPYHIFT